MTAWVGIRYGTNYHGPWKTKFIWLARINGTWVFCRNVHRRRHKFTVLEGKPLYDYAINDFELMTKTGSE